VDAGGLVIAEGDQAVATGRLVRNDLGDWFDPPHWVAGPGKPGGRLVGPVSKMALRVTGADFSAVTGRFEKDGAVEGWATLTGTWAGGEFLAVRQEPPAPRPAARTPWVTPPCPPPEGGWPAGPGTTPELASDLTDLAGTGATVAVTWFRPGEDQPVLVVAAADPAAVEARLRPRLGGSLCVVPSRWTKAQLDDVTSQLHQRLGQWSLSTLGRTSAADGQALISAHLFRILPEIAAWARSVPPGIVAFKPWLLPAGDGHGAPPESPAASSSPA
jgi:hypothetical protein